MCHLLVQLPLRRTYVRRTRLRQTRTSHFSFNSNQSPRLANHFLHHEIDVLKSAISPSFILRIILANCRVNENSCRRTELGNMPRGREAAIMYRSMILKTAMLYPLKLKNSMTNLLVALFWLVHIWNDLDNSPKAFRTNTAT
jgi:hypothetical protein